MAGTQMEALRASGRAVVLAWCCLATAGQAVAVPPKATVIDRQGNAHEVQGLTLNHREQVEYFVNGQRRVVSLREIARLRLGGEQGQEELPVTIVWPSGRSESGLMLAGASSAPHDDAIGGGGVSMSLEGNTALGPFLIALNDVQEIVLAASAAAAERIGLQATLITEEGRRFDLAGLEYRGGQRLDYRAGSQRRFVDLARVGQIDFAEGTANEEWRPATILLWNGKAIEAQIDASRVRLAGETDRAFHDRVNAAWTGRTAIGGFAVGTHAVRQIRFKAPDSEAAEAPTDSLERPAAAESPAQGLEEGGPEQPAPPAPPGSDPTAPDE